MVFFPMTNPLVSIIICSYNRAHLLPQTLASVFSQEYKPVEIIIVDDGSTDYTNEVIAGYGDSVRYFRQENKGIAEARTTGCRLAKGDFIAFHDDDDLMVGSRIVRLYEVFKDHPSAVLGFAECAWIDEAGSLTGKRSKFNLKVHNSKPVLINDGYETLLWPRADAKPSTTLFRRVDGERVGWFDTRFFHGCEDTDFFARIACLGPIVYLPEVVSYMRTGHFSLTSKRILMGYSQFLFFEKHLHLLHGNQRKLRKRLQFRLLKAMKKIAFCESLGLKRPDSISDDYLERGHSLLQYKGRLAYAWATSIKFPIRALLRKLFS